MQYTVSRCGPRLTANLNSGERCAACLPTKRALKLPTMQLKETKDSAFGKRDNDDLHNV